MSHNPQAETLGDWIPGWTIREYIGASVLIAIASVESLALMWWAAGEWYEKTTVALALVGAHGIGTRFFSTIGREDYMADLLSARSSLYISANLALVGLALSACGGTADREIRADYPRFTKLFDLLGVSFALAIVMPLSIVYVILITPLAYVLVLLVSAVVWSLSTRSGRPVTLLTGPYHIPVEINMKDHVKRNQLATKQIIMAAPGAVAVLGFGLQSLV